MYRTKVESPGALEALHDKKMSVKMAHLLEEMSTYF